MQHSESVCVKLYPPALTSAQIVAMIKSVGSDRCVAALLLVSSAVIMLVLADTAYCIVQRLDLVVLYACVTGSIKYTTTCIDSATTLKMGSAMLDVEGHSHGTTWSTALASHLCDMIGRFAMLVGPMWV